MIMGAFRYTGAVVLYAMEKVRRVRIAHVFAGLAQLGIKLYAQSAWRSPCCIRTGKRHPTTRSTLSI